MRGQIGDPALPPPEPPTDLEWLISFSRILPYEFDLTVTVDGTTYLADDLYCLRPGCSCDEVNVAFTNLLTSEFLGRVQAPSTQLEEATIEGPQLLLDVWDALLDKLESDVFEKRRRQIRAAVRSHQRVRPAVRSTKVGRNDPCPCGSGRKFKQCCGGAEPA